MSDARILSLAEQAVMLEVHPSMLVERADTTLTLADEFVDVLAEMPCRERECGRRTHRDCGTCKPCRARAYQAARRKVTWPVSNVSCMVKVSDNPDEDVEVPLHQYIETLPADSSALSRAQVQAALDEARKWREKYQGTNAYVCAHDRIAELERAAGKEQR